MPESELVLSLKGVHKNYTKSVATNVLHGINLTIAVQEFGILLGKSGSGKITLLNNTIGLLDTPIQGKVTLGGHGAA